VPSLLKDRDAPSAGASDPAAGVIVPDFACRACGGAMQAGQDWCLECGTAAPGRLGAKAGWRSAFTVVALVTLLVVGAVVASYAALTSDSQRQAAAPSQGDGTPIPAPGPAAAPPVAPIAPGATGPGTVPPAAGAAPGAVPTPGTATPGAIPGTTPGKAPPLIPTNPTPPATNTPVKPPAATPPVNPPPPPPPPPPASTKPAAPKPQIIALRPDAAKTYDPANRAGAEFGPASFAIDKTPKTVWDVTVPADGKPIGAGLLINLGKPYSLRALKLATPTKGFRVELYGAQGKQTPEDILDKRWEHLTDIRSVEDGKIVSLAGKSKNKLQLLLIYVTTVADRTDPRAAIGDVDVAGTP